MSNERRKVPRYFAELTADLVNHETGVSQEVQVEVLSVQGCCVRGTGTPESGRNCRFVFRWKGEEFRAEAQVVWKDPRGLSGLRFVSTDQESITRLRTLCAGLRLQPLTPWSARSKIRTGNSTARLAVAKTHQALFETPRRLGARGARGVRISL